MILEGFLPLPKESEIATINLVDTHEDSNQKKPKDGKTYVFDLKAQIGLIDMKKKFLLGDKKNVTEMVDVEIQTNDEKHLTNQMTYAARTYSNQLLRGEGYDKLRPVHSLIFSAANFEEFANIDDYYHVCRILREEEPHRVFSRGMTFTVVELNKFRDQEMDDSPNI